MGPKSNAKRSTSVTSSSSAKKKGSKGGEDVAVVEESPQKAMQVDAEVVPSEVPPVTKPIETQAVPSSSSSAHRKPTVHDIVSDSITELAQNLWAGNQGSIKFHESTVKQIYEREIQAGNRSRWQLLELSGYLEHFLWPHYSGPTSSVEHVISMMVLINEKYNQESPAFTFLVQDEDKVTMFMEHLVDLFLEHSLAEAFLPMYVQFWTNAFRSIELEAIRKNTLRYLSLPLWQSLSTVRLSQELSDNDNIAESWKKLQNYQKSLSETSQSTGESEKKGKASNKRKKPEVDSSSQLKSFNRDSQFVPSLLQQFFAGLESFQISPTTLKFVERVAELLIELLSQRPTRRFLSTLLRDEHIVTRCQQSKLVQDANGKLFNKLVTQLDFYLHFEINDVTGQPKTYQEVLEESNVQVTALQQIAFAHYPEKLKDLVYTSVGEVMKRTHLDRSLTLLSDEEIVDVATRMRLLTEKDKAAGRCARAYVMALLYDVLIPRGQQQQFVSQTPVYPTEVLLWDEDKLPSNVNYTPEQILALPKLNLQYLTIADYLLRNFQLFQLESAYEIREDLVKAIEKMEGKTMVNQNVAFGGWSSMAVPILSVSIDDVARPKIGEVVPSRINCTVEIDLARFSGSIRDEWEAFREHDVVFLVTIERPSSNNKTASFPQQYGVKYIRGGELFEYRDEANVVLNDFSRPDERPGRVGSKRKVRLNLDPQQYHADMQAGRDCYDKVNLLIRRNSKENNFKSILDTIRNLVNTAAIGRAIPAWLQDVFLGYGDPASASYRALNTSDVESIDFADTFLDLNHVVASFPTASSFTLVDVNGEEVANVAVDSIQQYVNTHQPPYKVEIHRASSTGSKETGKRQKAQVDGAMHIKVISYQAAPRGPYPEDYKPKNVVPFTSTQVDAIRSGVNPGLTMIVGPPGTGKTDVAVQIIANLYKNYPQQRILVVTHSNAAVNDIFEKIMQKDVDPRHLLRLGSGEADLRVEGESVFSKQGRVNYSLTRRLQLLAQVQRLAFSLGIIGDVGSSCETASYFYNNHVLPNLASYAKVVVAGDFTAMKEQFPFAAFFADVPGGLVFSGTVRDVEMVQGCLQHIEHVFDELREYRAFELLRTQNLRCDYLLTKQARIVAMTCTHAAMTRSRLVELGFKYDSIVMEEAGQILEVETLIPMLLQDSDPVEGSRLKRVVLLGDHKQLPPIVQHQAIQKYCKFEQSMFSRLIRLGVPSIQLDMQGRARPDIAALYNWRYDGLGDLPQLQVIPAYQKSNAGFVHHYQFIDVGDFQGVGESAPTPFFYQNRGEAEYVVAVFQYMRLLGYPAEKISILTTYNGQRALIQDILNQRCAKNALFGKPAHVSTVDKFQGQQNDFILLSMVRTDSVGHIRDLRRLVVALSRARLGLYVFGRRQLYENCYELLPAMSRLLQKPTKLALLAGEAYPSNRDAADHVAAKTGVFEVEDVTAMGILVYQMVQQAQSLQHKQA